MKKTLEEDIRLCQENPHEEVLKFLKTIEDRFLQERKLPPILSF